MPKARYGDLDDVAWYVENSGRERLDSAKIFGWQNYVKRLEENGNGAHEVAKKRANGFGLYDTLGNVGEWVNDWYHGDYYENSPPRDPSGPSSGQFRFQRGRSWANRPTEVRVSGRVMSDPADWNDNSGVRCVGEANIP